jgi:ketosteroid isomerase-like protein
MRTHHHRRLAAAALALQFLVPPALSADETSDRKAIEAAAQGLIKSFNARDVGAMIALATEDVVLLDPSLSPVRGHEAARRAWEQSAGATQGAVTTATKEIVVAGDLAWRIGALAHKLPTGVVNSQSLEIWKRGKGGWKIHRQMSSGLLAPPKFVQQPPISEPVRDTP